LFKRKKQIILVTIVLFVISVIVGPVYAEFGEGNSFNDQAKSFNSDKLHNNRPYFIHDTLIKLIALMIFVALALYIFLKKHNWRKYILILSVLILGFYLQGFLCPLTAIQNVFSKYNTAYLLLFLVPLILALFYGRIFCGYICPFGAIQELIFFPKLQLKIPAGLRKFLNKFKYILLIYMIIRILVTREVILVSYTPFKSLFTLGGTPGTIIVTVITAILSIIVFRPFCRFVCPLGALLGLFSCLRKNEIVSDSNCVQCGKCTEECLVDAVEDNEIDMKECIVCCQCLDCCPVNKNNL